MQPVDDVAKSARLCGYVGQTVVIYQRPDGACYCNFKENRGCDQQTTFCRLREVEEAERAGGE